MRIDDQVRKCVAFLSIREENYEPGVSRFIPVGTAFFVGVGVGRDRVIKYIITARHVIENSRPRGPLYLRCVNNDGATKIFELPQEFWWSHPTADVAAARIAFPLEDYGISFLPLDYLASREYMQQNDIGIGDHLVISGLFAQYIGSTRDEPLLRFGRIALIPSEKIRVPAQGGSPEMQMDAILAEAAAWGGQSGSPAFVYCSIDRQLFAGNRLQLQLPRPALLGLIHGHYTISQPISGEEEYRVPLNAGIAILVPAEKIIELLNLPEVVEDLEQIKTILREEGLID